MHQAQNVLSIEEGQNRFLAIEVNGHGFGIPIESVREIVYYSSINPLPQAPHFVRGVALIRQETIPVLDLNILLGGDKHTAIHHESCFIVLQLADDSGRRTRICLLAERILQTYKINIESVDAAPTIGDDSVVNYILGVARVAEQIFVLIDPAKLISPLLENVQPYVAYSVQADESNLTELIPDKNPSSGHAIHKNQYKFLSVFINEDEYAIPLSSVSQVINKSSLSNFINNDVPDVLFSAAVFTNKPLGLLRLSTVISRTQTEPEEDEGEKNNITQAIATDSTREVVVLIKFYRGFLGIIVDRIGATYESDSDLQKNSFCTGLKRNRIKSLGFIEKNEGSIEVIDPTSVLTKVEQTGIESWMSCIDRMITMSESKQAASAEPAKDETANPFAVFAGSYLLVQVGDELVGLNNTDVDEVLTYAELIPLNNGPDWFSGLLELRQHTYPIIDLHIKLDVNPSAQSEGMRKVLVMIKYGQKKLGLLVDKVIHSIHLDSAQLYGPERSKLMIKPSALDAVAEFEQQWVHIINLQNVIQQEQLSTRNLLEELNHQAETNDRGDIEISGI